MVEPLRAVPAGLRPADGGDLHVGDRPWVEDQAPALHNLAAILRNPGEHGFAEAQREAVETRDAYIAGARETLGRRRDLAPDGGGFAVGVLQLVDARCSGVMFTLDPSSGARDRVVIEGNRGLGETVVSGQVTPDRWSVKRGSGRIRERHGGDTHVQLVFDAGRARAVETEVPADLATQACLTDDEVRHLVRRGTELEAHEGVPQDIEWAVHRGMELPDRVFFLQHRPETTWGEHTGTDGGALDPVEYSLRSVFRLPRS